MYKYFFIMALTYAIGASVVAESMLAGGRGDVSRLSKTVRADQSSGFSRFAEVKTITKKSSGLSSPALAGWPRVGAEGEGSRPFNPGMLVDEEDQPRSRNPLPPSHYQRVAASIVSPPLRHIDKALGFDPDWVEAKRVASVGEGPCGGVRVWKVAALGPESRADMQPSVIANATMIDALSGWEQQVQLAAMRYLGEPVESVINYGSYVCKRIMNRKFGPWSEHAKANALDVAGFRTASGKTISISQHWSVRGRERQFLLAAHRAACTHFNVVLGPSYNRAHDDHLHIDMGPHKACH